MNRPLILPLFLSLLLLSSCKEYDKTKFVTKHVNTRDTTTNYPFISGDVFRQFSDHIIDDTHVPFYPHLVREGDIVFLKTKYMKRFLKHMHHRIKNPYILVTHNGDEEIPGKYESLLDDDKIMMWFGINVTMEHPKLVPIPIGFGCPWLMDIRADLEKRELKKERLLYLNFSSTHPEREKAREYFTSTPFCTMGKRKPYNEYFEDIATSKFQVSPRGNGIDCHRVWETIFVGTIPVIKSTGLDPLYKDLPILIVNDWSEVTEEFLEQKYSEITTKDYDFNVLYADYWLKMIESYSNRKQHTPEALSKKSTMGKYDTYPQTWKEVALEHKSI